MVLLDLILQILLQKKDLKIRKNIQIDLTVL